MRLPCEDSTTDAELGHPFFEAALRGERTGGALCKFTGANPDGDAALEVGLGFRGAIRDDAEFREGMQEA